jgi:hypothetical protein
MQTLSLAQSAYIAGIVDGEGHIGVQYKRPKKHYWSPHYQPLVIVTNTWLPLLEWCQTRTGIGTISPRAKVLGRKNAYAWYLRSDEQVTFLHVVLPYLIVKAEQARTLLEFHNIRGSDPNYIMQHVLYEELVELNLRGQP